MPYVLSVITFLPLVGAALILGLRMVSRDGEPARVVSGARWISLITTLVVLALSVWLVAAFDPAEPGYQFVEQARWFAGASYHLGVDGISILFVLLTAFLLPLCVVAS